MDDEHRQPRDGDRSPVRDRIKRAVTDGRITAADGAIRLTNVGSAQSIGELGLIVRDLDQLEASIPVAAPAAAISVPQFSPAATRGPRRLLPVVIAIVAVLGVTGGAVSLFAFSSGTDSVTSTGLQDPVTVGTDPSATGDPVAGASPAGSTYSISVPGIRSFLTKYRERFGTTEVVEATFYDDYAVIQVPVPGEHRHSGWIYRPVNGFTDFGGVMADFPGSTDVDLARLDLSALLKNVARAKRVLKVADANQTYVNIDFRPGVDPAANVNIYLTNEFKESGYLATRLNGTVERSYPFDQ